MNSLVMFGPYLAFVLFQLLILVINEDHINNFLIYLGIILIYKKGLVFTLCGPCLGNTFITLSSL